MSVKFNNVQHFKLIPSQTENIVVLLLNVLTLVLLLFSSLDLLFKVLLSVLLLLFYFYNNQLQSPKEVKSIEICLDKLYITQVANLQRQQAIIVSIRQSRWFAEIIFEVKQHSFKVLLFPDSFDSVEHFHSLMQYVRQNQLQPI